MELHFNWKDKMLKNDKEDFGFTFAPSLDIWFLSKA
jgi:hypothetical protein